MASPEESVVEALNRLIQTCKDGENGFHTAAGAVKTPELKHLFDSYGAERARFASELQAEVEKRGGKPQESGSVAGVLHRGWMNIRSAVGGHNESAIIAECETGEDAALKAFEETLRVDLPEELRIVILRQLDQIKEAHARIRALRDVTAKS